MKNFRVNTKQTCILHVQLLGLDFFESPFFSSKFSYSILFIMLLATRGNMDIHNFTPSG